jgi:hypothetical protein
MVEVVLFLRGKRGMRKKRKKGKACDREERREREGEEKKIDVKQEKLFTSLFRFAKRFVDKEAKIAPSCSLCCDIFGRVLLQLESKEQRSTATLLPLRELKREASPPSKINRRLLAFRPLRSTSRVPI